MQWNVSQFEWTAKCVHRGLSDTDTVNMMWWSCNKKNKWIFDYGFVEIETKFGSDDAITALASTAEGGSWTADIGGQGNLKPKSIRSLFHNFFQIRC